MAASGDITIAQDGGQGNVKLHPYLVTLVRWCVSCVWSTATVLLHRLMTTPLQPIMGSKLPLPKPKIPKRVAGTEHLHPEPKVECQLLHQPATHSFDVIFVHGLYGSLGNTWRQGDWRLKYKADPQIVPLSHHSTPNACNCNQNTYNNLIYNNNKSDNINLNDSEMLEKINEKLSKKVIPRENDLITEHFYNNTLLDQVHIIENYETQAKFVRDLFKKETNCDKQQNKYNTINDYDKIDYNENDDKCYENDKYNEINELNECKCNLNEKKCEIGCGCVCNACYSTCWPRDWIKMDFPEARVISVNYTSDPYLWRPLWIKENKRLNLHQRAEQMIEQLLDMGVGEKPIIWVGHSKGGLFIKQIYCEAYEAYMKTNKNSDASDQTSSNDKTENEIQEKSNETEKNGITAENIDTIIGHFIHNNEERKISLDNYTGNNDNSTGNNDNSTRNNDNYTRISENFTGKNDNYTGNKDNYTDNKDNYVGNIDKTTGNNDNYTRMCDDCTGNNGNFTKNYDDTRNIDNFMNNNNYNACVMNETIIYNNVFEQIHIFKNESANNDNLENLIYNDNSNLIIKNGNGDLEKTLEEMKSDNIKVRNKDEEINSSIKVTERVSRRAALWAASRGFMFYSVPHRGSPLADIKTPVTARSVDLLEIAKDCPLVLELQERWLRAVRGGGGGGGGGGASGGGGRVAVRSFVETCRTLMSVLWLRIVSTDSADAGIGTLSGISVDHREICKPSSRSCLLYTELKNLINEALKCRCQ